MLVKQFQIERLTNELEANRIVDFFLSDYSFDDTRYTPGELKHFQELPYRALAGEIVFWYAINEQNEIIGINCIAENEQKTGGFNWDYIVVHQAYRKSGLAAGFIEEMFQFLEQAGARYVVTYTCDLPQYSSIQRLFLRNGFQLVGRCPDYYFAGEDRLIYYRQLD